MSQIFLDSRHQKSFAEALPARPFYDAVSGVFLESELELIDPSINLPAVWTTYPEDMQLRQGLSIDYDSTSFTFSNYGRSGAGSTTGKAWQSIVGNDAPNTSYGIQKIQQRVEIWAQNASWTFVELARSQKLQRPVDVDKLLVLQEQWNQDADNQAYLGDPSMGMFGLANANLITANEGINKVTNVTNAVTGGWAAAFAANPTTAAASILNDLRELDQSIYTATGGKYPATKIIVPYSLWSILNWPIAIAGAPLAISIREYFEKNSIGASQGRPFKLVPRKWVDASLNTGFNYNNTLTANRMIGYTDTYECLRYDLTPLLHTPIWIANGRQSVQYYGGMGGVEIVRPSTIAYRDNI